MRPDPYVPADMDRLGDHVEPVQRIELMVERGQDDLMADQRPVADVDAALVLEAAIRVDENVLADMDIAPEIGLERREQAERGINLLPDELGEQAPDLIHLLVPLVDLGGYLPGLGGLRIHQGVGLRGIDAQAFGNCGNELLDGHFIFSTSLSGSSITSTFSMTGRGYGISRKLVGRLASLSSTS